MNEIVKNENSWHTIQELAELCGVNVDYLRNNIKRMLFGLNFNVETRKEGKSHQVFYSGSVLKALKQYQMRNSTPNALKDKQTAILTNASFTVNETTEKLMTTKELSEQLHTSKDVVIANARKCLPNKIFEHGKTAYWNKSEVTVVLDYMKHHTSNNRSVELNSTVEKISTELTPALKIKKAMELMQEGYEEELAILRAKNAAQKAVIDRIENGRGCFSMNQAAKALKLPYGNITLYKKLRALKILNNDNSPNQEQIKSGNFKVVVKFINEKVGSRAVTLATSKGLVYLAKKLDASIDESVKADFAEQIERAQ